LGFDPATSLALAGSRRIRDLIMFLPGLVAWQVAEATGASYPPESRTAGARISP